MFINIRLRRNERSNVIIPRRIDSEGASPKASYKISGRIRLRHSVGRILFHLLEIHLTYFF